MFGNFSCATQTISTRFVTTALSLRPLLNLRERLAEMTAERQERVRPMLHEIWDSFIMLIPVFILLTMIFGAGFYIGRVSKKEE